MLTAIRKQLRVRESHYLHHPKFPNRRFRRYCVWVMIKHGDQILRERGLCLKAEYGLGQGGATKDKGPFTYRQYLMYMLEKDSWGDEVVSRVLLLVVSLLLMPVQVS